MGRKPSLLLLVPLLLFTRVLFALAEGPQKLVVCDFCKMKVADEGKKRSVFLPNNSGMGPASFCDIGCAVQSRNNECATRQMTFDSNALVYDFVTGEAVAAEKAFFAFKSDLRTPMGSGIVAFKDKAAAEMFAREHGKVKVLRWFELMNERM